MRVLFLTGSPSTYMAPPQLAEEQIVAGPDWPDAQTPEGKWLSLRTPVGTYDLAAVLARIPAGQRPDAVVSLVDASWRNQPRNVGAFRGPKALLVADTHHLNSPLLGMFQYAATERYDRVVFLYDRHHVGFFQSLGFRNLSWFPGLTFAHDDATVAGARAATREPRIAFIGQAGKFHPQRVRLLGALRSAGLPVDQRVLPQREALRFCGHSLLGFNASLNGDLNLRVFETLATGTALLTDRLAPASGLLELFAEGRELITYGSAGELAERAAYALAHPAETAAVGAAGAAWFDTHFSADRRRHDFERLVMDGTPAARFELPLPAATRVFFNGETGTLLRTLMVYEGVQELHRTKESVRVALTPGVHEDVASAFATLPRVEVVRGPLSTEADITVFTRDDDIVPAAIHAPRVWCWDALPEEQVTLNEFLQPAGFSPVSADAAVLCRIEAEHPEQVIKKGFDSGDAHLLLVGLKAREQDDANVITCLLQSIQREPNLPICWHALGLALCAVGRGDDGISALLRAVVLGKPTTRLQLDLAELAITRQHGAIAVPAAEAVHAAEPGEAAAELLARARQVAAENARLEPRDLLISHIEVTDRQGTGVLLKRLFPDAGGFVTVRSRSQHGGKVEFGGIQLSLDLPLPSDARCEILRRLLASYRIRRILAVPYFAADFEHALAARTLARAPLCTFAMDDQAVYCRHVPRELARKLFAASDLCLAISPEMAATYEQNFKRPFHFMPPVLTTAEDAVPNCWTPEQSPANRVAMLGNVWTAKRFEQLREFVRRTGWQVDWYGPGPNASWLQVDPPRLAADGIHCRGFLPEGELITALAGYPAVLIPSGMLDATEDNEAFSRLSLPSRMLFVLVKTRTPMLVLGSPETAAGRFVLKYGIGRCTSFDPAEAASKLRELADPEIRAAYLAAAEKTAGHFVLPGAGEWIWASLARRQPQPAPFNSPGIMSADSPVAPAPEAAPDSLKAAYSRKLNESIRARDAAAAIAIMRSVLVDPAITDVALREDIINFACSIAASVAKPSTGLRKPNETRTCVLLYQPWMGFDYARLLKTASESGVFMPIFAGKRATGKRVVTEVSPDNFRSLVYRGVSLWSVCQYFLALQFSSMPETLRVDTKEKLALVHNQFDYAAKLIDEAFDFIRCYRPDSVILTQGYFTNAAVLRHVAILSGVRVVSLEITMHRGRMLWEDIAGAAVNTHLAKNYYWRFRSFVSDAQARETTDNYLATIRQHKAAEHTAPAAAALPMLEDKQRTIVYLGQVSTDAAVLYGRRGFASQADAIRAVAEYAAEHSLRLVVKLHPKESPAHKDPLPYYKYLTKRWLDADSKFQAVRARLGDRLIIDADNELDTYALIRRADVCVTLTSQSGLEALLHGREVVLCGEAYFGGLGFTHEAPDAISLHHQLDRVMASGHRLNDGIGCRKFFHIFTELYCLPKTEETIVTLATGRPAFPLPPPLTTDDLPAPARAGKNPSAETSSTLELAHTT